MDEKQFQDLRETLDKIARVDEHRAELISERDRQLAALRAAGATWVQLQEFAGLSVRGLQLALQRAAKNPRH